jgi:hypothetical protein
MLQRYTHEDDRNPTAYGLRAIECRLGGDEQALGRLRDRARRSLPRDYRRAEQEDLRR